MVAWTVVVVVDSHQEAAAATVVVVVDSLQEAVVASVTVVAAVDSVTVAEVLPEVHQEVDSEHDQ